MSRAAAMLLTVTGLAGCAGADSAPEGRAGDSAGPVFPTSREAWRWPFTAESAWNMPVGSGLATAGADDPCTAGVRDDSVDAWVNAAEWSHPVYRAADGDPVVPVTEDGERLGEVQSPAGATPADPQYPEGDAHLHLVNPAGDSVTEIWQARSQEGGWEVSSVAVVDLLGPGIGTDGVRIYGGSAVGGPEYGGPEYGGTEDGGTAVGDSTARTGVSLGVCVAAGRSAWLVRHASSKGRSAARSKRGRGQELAM